MRYPLIKPKYYYSLLKDIALFIKSPRIDTIDKSTKFKIYDTIGLFFLKLIFLIPVVIFFAVVYDPENISTSKMSERFSPLVFLMVAGIILPFVEEIGFRLSLKFKPIYLALSSGVFLYYLLTKAVFFTKVSAVDESFIIRIGSAIVLILILFPLFNLQSVKDKLVKFWNNNFNLIYYFTCIAFAWVHMSKYEITWLNIVLLPILTMPQLMSGIISGYTRVAFGFQYPLLFHMTTNLIMIGMSFLPFSD